MSATRRSGRVCRQREPEERQPSVPDPGTEGGNAGDAGKCSDSDSDESEKSTTSQCSSSSASSTTQPSCTASDQEEEEDDDEEASAEVPVVQRATGHARRGRGGRRAAAARDPRNALFPARRYARGTGAPAASIGRAMHRGDDEGRPPPKRVKVTCEEAADGEEAAARDCEEDVDGCLGGNDEAEEEEADDEESAAGGGNGRSTKRRQSKRFARARIGGHREGDGGDGGGDGGDGGGDDNNSDEPAQRRPQNRVRLPKCWLCTFANSKMAKQVAAFVSCNAGTMDPTIMAEQIKHEVLREYPHALGIGRHNVLRHLREHVLTPNVRMASIIRSLITLAETLRCTLQQIDEDTGDVMVDIKNTELYLKVISQIHSVYRTEGSKMLFGGGSSLGLQGNHQQQANQHGNGASGQAGGGNG